MASAAKKMKFDEKTSWFDMPYEMRNMIIDLMDIQTTTRFSQCSIDCYEEVGKSLNFIDEIKIDQKDNFGSCVVFDLKKKDSIENYRFVIGASEFSAKMARDFKGRHKCHNVIVTGGFYHERIYEHTIQFLNGLMKIARKSLRKLEIDAVDFPYNRSKIGYLPNLEELRLSPHLKKRDCCEIIDPIDCKFIEFNQICKIRKYLSIPRLSLSYVLHLTAEKIYIAYVTSAPLIFRDFLHFIRNAEIDENIRNIRFGVEHDSSSYSYSSGFFYEDSREKQFFDIIKNVEGKFAERVTCDNRRHEFMTRYLKNPEKMLIVGEFYNTIEIETKIGGFEEKDWTML